MCRRKQLKWKTFSNRYAIEKFELLLKSVTVATLLWNSFFKMSLYHLYYDFAKTKRLFELQKVKILMKLFSENYAFILLKFIFNKIGERKLSQW